MVSYSNRRKSRLTRHSLSQHTLLQQEIISSVASTPYWKDRTHPVGTSVLCTLVVGQGGYVVNWMGQSVGVVLSSAVCLCRMQPRRFLESLESIVLQCWSNQQ